MLTRASSPPAGPQLDAGQRASPAVARRVRPAAAKCPRALAPHRLALERRQLFWGSFFLSNLHNHRVSEVAATVNPTAAIPDRNAPTVTATPE